MLSILQLIRCDNEHRLLRIEEEVNLRPVVRRPFCLGVGLPSAARGQISFLSDDCAFLVLRIDMQLHTNNVKELACHVLETDPLPGFRTARTYIEHCSVKKCFIVKKKTKN
jgi:hypothetical protein